MWNNFQSFTFEKERIWGNVTKTVQNHPMQHTHKHMFNETTIWTFLFDGQN